MVDWLKSLDGYGWFCLVLFGPLGAFVAVSILGTMALFAYTDMVESFSWASLIAFIVIFGPLCLLFTFAFMGVGGDIGGCDRNDSAAKQFVHGWFALIGMTVVLFVLPALAVLGMKQVGVYDFLKALIA